MNPASGPQPGRGGRRATPVARALITGERRLAAAALARSLAELGVRTEVRIPLDLGDPGTPGRAVVVQAQAWSAGLGNLLRHLHAQGRPVFVAPLSDQGIDRLRAMRHGALDVIPHGPEQAEELVLKLQRLVLKPPPRPDESPLFRVGPYVFDPVRRQLHGQAAVVELTPTQAVILYCLVTVAGQDPDRRLRVPELLALCRLPGLTPTALRKHVFELRAKLEREADVIAVVGDLRAGLGCDPKLVGRVGAGALPSPG